MEAVKKAKREPAKRKAASSKTAVRLVPKHAVHATSKYAVYVAYQSLPGLDLSHRTMESDDLFLAREHGRIVANDKATCMQNEIDFYNFTPFASATTEMHSLGRISDTPFRGHLQGICQEVRQMAYALLGESIYVDPQYIRTDFVTYANKWLKDNGVRTLPSTAHPSSFEGAMFLLQTVNQTLNSEFAVLLKNLSGAIHAGFSAADTEMPDPLVNDVIREYIVVNRPEPTVPTVKVRRMLLAMMFPLRHSVPQQTGLLHSRLLGQWLAYRRQAADIVDKILTEQFKDLASAFVVIPKRTTRRRRTGDPDTGYFKMKYSVYGFTRTGRHSWKAMVVGTRLDHSIANAPVDSSGTLKPSDAPRSIRIRQSDLEHKAHTLDCLSPRLEIVLAKWWPQSVSSQLVNYWEWAIKQGVGLGFAAQAAQHTQDLSPDVTAGLAFKPTPPGKPSKPIKRPRHTAELL